MRIEGEHTHIFSMCGGGIRIIVVNNVPDMCWNKWFDTNPEARERLQALLLKELSKKMG